MTAPEPSAVDAVVGRISQVYRRWKRDTPPEQMRQDWDALFGALPYQATTEPFVAGRVHGTWFCAPGVQADRVVLYFHGGGFKVGSTHSHAELMAGLSAEAGCRVLGIDYRLAPEHRYPAAHDDARQAFDGLLAQGFEAGQIALAGDSAGACLVLSLLLALRDEKRSMPAAAAVMSAWTDLSASGDSYETCAKTDPIHQRFMVQAMAQNYLGPDVDPRDPKVSPLWAALHDLPPLLMQVGGGETVLSDSNDFAEKARAAGVQVDLQVWAGMVHVFQQFPNELVQARTARMSLGSFLRMHLNPSFAHTGS